MVPQLHLSKTTYNCHLVHEAFNFVAKNDMKKLYPDLSIKKYQDMVVCQWPRKTCGTQVCYLQEPLSHHF